MNYYNIERSSRIENLSTESESGVELCVCKNKNRDNYRLPTCGLTRI